MDFNSKRSVNHSRRQRLSPSAWAFGTVVAYMAVLHWLSSIPGRLEPERAMDLVYISLTPTIQNLLHIPAFAVLAWLWSRVLPITLGGSVLVLLISVGYGAYDEWFQLSVPGRYGSLTDCLLDLFGALVGVALYRCRYRWSRSRIP